MLCLYHLLLTVGLFLLSAIPEAVKAKSSFSYLVWGVFLLAGIASLITLPVSFIITIS